MKNINSILCLGLLLLLCNNISYIQDTPEFLIDTSIVFGPSYDFQGNPEIAFDGTNYLAVWEFDRDGNTNIRGTFIDQSGGVLNPYGFNITNTSDNHLTPDVAFDGTNYLVVWCEEKINPENRDIVGTRITSEGKILDPEGIKISVTPEDQTLPTIAFGGAYYFVAWNERDTIICGTRVSPTGEVQDTLGIIIGSQHITYKNCMISDGKNYLVCWNNMIPDPGIYGNYGTLINQNGEVLVDTIEILTSTVFWGQFNPIGSLGFDGDNYFFVGNIAINSPYTWASVVGIKINKRGTVIDTTIISLGVTSSVSYNDGYYLVGFTKTTWGNDPNVYARRVDKSGILLDSTDINITNFANQSDWASDHQIASDGTNSLIIWHTGGYYSNQGQEGYLEGSRVDKNGTVLDPDGVIISKHPNSQFTPTVASDGPNYFIVWNDSRYNFWDIYGTRIDQQGNNLNPNGICIRKESSDAKVTFGGSYYMAVWIRYEPPRGICRARIDQGGILLDTSSVAISGGYPTRASIASDGDKYLIIDDYGNGILVDQSGMVINTFPINCGENPRIAFNGSNYLVVWHNQVYSDLNIYGTLVDTIGNVLQPECIQISIDEGHQVYPSVASDGTNYIVVWQDNLDPPTNIWGARLDSSGTLIDTVAFAISLAQGDQEKPVVAFNGNEYVVIWQDNRNGVDYDIYGARVSANGNVIDSFVVSNAIGDQLSPEITYSSHNQVLVVYSGWTGEYEGKLYDCMRIWGKYLESVAGIEDQPSEIVTEYKLEQCYPNPFNPSTTIQYSIKEKTTVELVLYDILGRKVEVLVKGERGAGHYKVNFNAGKLASGVYLYRLKAGDFAETKKMVLMK